MDLEGLGEVAPLGPGGFGFTGGSMQQANGRQAVACAPAEPQCRERQTNCPLIPAGLRAQVPVLVQAFGSHANGLALHESDIDVVIQNLAKPEDQRTGGTPCLVHLIKRTCPYPLLNLVVLSAFSRTRAVTFTHPRFTVLSSFRLCFPRCIPPCEAETRFTVPPSIQPRLPLGLCLPAKLLSCCQGCQAFGFF